MRTTLSALVPVAVSVFVIVAAADVNVTSTSASVSPVTSSKSACASAEDAPSAMLASSSKVGARTIESTVNWIVTGAAASFPAASVSVADTVTTPSPKTITSAAVKTIA